MKSKRTIATDISKEVRKEVIKRDANNSTLPRCIFCGSAYNLQLAHFVPRSKSGKGIPQNLACACWICHENLDKTDKRKPMLEQFEKHLKKHYKNWNKDDLIYRKGE